MKLQATVCRPQKIATTVDGVGGVGLIAVAMATPGSGERVGHIVRSQEGQHIGRHIGPFLSYQGEFR